MKSLHISLNAAYSECKPSTSMSSTHSFQILFLPLPLTPPPPLFYKPIPNHPHSYAPDVRTTSICHASPHLYWYYSYLINHFLILLKLTARRWSSWLPNASHVESDSHRPLHGFECCHRGCHRHTVGDAEELGDRSEDGRGSSDHRSRCRTPAQLWVQLSAIGVRNNLLFLKVRRQNNNRWRGFQIPVSLPNWLVWRGILPPKTRSNFPWDRKLPFGD